MLQQTLSIIKPDATKRHLIGEILSILEQNNFVIKALKMVHLTKEQAEGFYAEHQGKAFFESLVEFMISGPIVVIVIEGENAITRYRDLMGATDPEKRQKDTIRARYSLSYRENTVHGSDSEISAKREIAYFFTPNEIMA
ncbi:nucleoside-diphosphate kinase [Vespertiliibacter pulmonis]|uniref:Nucleoside diphosphate kinase n=1 Tax=Vespertiliibacter pulmonis TaxID=1443036 RepID=A0A3N4VZ25_9PAST|nr:nucleoside-diphosphate kinase [Vespertiliibacter pulmonis]QLB20436.1 nucleoside-diphosphate kinase [Vespertiliibacter pulmonis]RPE86425.1 nucleoside diphosphate kinase [Vespertiliibacter pulmonis]